MKILGVSCLLLSYSVLGDNRLPKHLQFLSDQSQVLKELNSDLDTNPITDLYTSYTRHLKTGFNRDQSSRSTWDQETDSSKVLNTRLDVGGRETRDTYQRFRTQLFTPQTKHQGFKQRNNRHFKQNVHGEERRDGAGRRGKRLSLLDRMRNLLYPPAPREEYRRHQDQQFQAPVFRLVTHPPTVRSIPHTHRIRVQPNLIQPNIQKHHQPNLPPPTLHHQPNLPPPTLHHQPNLPASAFLHQKNQPPHTFHHQPNLPPPTVHQPNHHNQPHTKRNHLNSIKTQSNQEIKHKNHASTFQNPSHTYQPLEFQPSQTDGENTQFLDSDFDLKVRNPSVRQVSINSFSSSTGGSRFYTESTGAGEQAVVLDLVGTTGGFNPPNPDEIIIISKPENENENVSDDVARFKVLEPIISVKSEPIIQKVEENFKDDFEQDMPEYKEDKVTFSTYESQQLLQNPEPEQEPIQEIIESTTILPVVEETTPYINTFRPITPKQYIPKSSAQTESRNPIYPSPSRSENIQVAEIKSMSREEFEESINQVLEKDRYVSEGYEELLEEKIAEIQRQADLLEEKYWGGRKDYEI